MDANDPTLLQFTSAAKGYCRLIENIDPMDCRTCLATMAGLLPQLGEAAEKLPMVPAEAVHTGSPEFDARFSLFSRIRSALGKLDAYRLEYDHPDEEQDLSGSLADDFTDIYFDLRYGLALLETHPDEPAKATDSWKTSYELHWKEHLDGATRQLDQLLKSLA
jgi:hypothetical protein